MPAYFDLEPLPFHQTSNGTLTLFAMLLDPDTRTRQEFALYQLETLVERLTAETLHHWVQATFADTTADDSQPSPLRRRLLARQ